MRQLTPGMLDALEGSIPDARLVVNAWYDGQLVEKGPTISNWSLNWDGSDSQLVQGRSMITVADDTGRLAPWGFDEPLSAAGSRLQVSFVVGSGEKAESVDLAWLTITANSPTEQWKVVGSALTWVSGGASVPVEAADLTQLVSDSKFVAPEAPPSGATVISEVKRLMAGICPVNVAADVVDKAVPSSIVYKDDRLAAVSDLVRAVNCRYRMNGSGQLEVYTLTRTAPVWTIQGRDGGAMVSLNRTQARADLINGVVSTGNDPSLELRALATLTTGPLRWDGPFGRKVEFHNAIANTQTGVQDDAQTILNNSTVLKTMPLTVLCKPNPAIQTGDWVRLAAPVIDGTEYPLDGVVTGMELKGSTAGVEAMRLVVNCSMADVQAVGAYVRRATAS